MEDCGGVTIKFPTAESRSDKVKKKKFFDQIVIVIDKYIPLYVHRFASEVQKTMWKKQKRSS